MESTPNRRQLTAILLDDDPSQAYLLERTLEAVTEFELELKVYSNSAQAMPDLLSARADLLFLDHHLSEGRTGLEVLKLLRESGVEAAIIMMTGTDNPKLCRSFVDFGANAYLCKSDLDSNHLSATINDALKFSHSPRGTNIGDSEQVGRRAV